MPGPIAIVQARMGSSRLPGKVLIDLAGTPVLLWVIRRVRRTSGLDGVIVATSDGAIDDPIEKFCEQENVACVRGSEMDLTSRFRRAAMLHDADPIVRITGDCPLIDPKVVARVLAKFRSGTFDYVSNVYPRRTFPRGLDVEVLSAACLARVDAEDRDPGSREHVTLYVRQNPERFRIASVESRPDLSGMRWTLDTEKDLMFLRQLLSRATPTDGVKTRDLVRILEREPELLRINRDVIQKVG